MKKITLAVTLFLLSTAVLAWTIGPMNYQGRLLDDAGIPVTATLNFKVRIYDAASGGTLKFSEEQNSISVDDGVYSFLVSTGTNSTGAWDIALWNTPQLFLEVEVGGETLSPRHLMAATPYAYQANLALTTNNALALGGKSSGAILEDICKANKGKWLELVSQCLGVGTSFPGPDMVGLNTLTASTDLTYIDLTNADISGINFGMADFTGAVLKNTIINPDGIAQTVMVKALLDSVVSAGSGYLTVDFTGATIKNMDLSTWSMDGAVLQGASIAGLSSCPSSLPYSWECRDTEVEPGGFFLLGPGVNLSATSAVAVSKFGASYLNLGENTLNNIDLSYANFNGNFIEQNFTNTMLMHASFDHTTLIGNVFDSCVLESTSFVGSTIKFPSFTNVQGGIFTNLDFSRAELQSVLFSEPVEGGKFSRTTLNDVQFANASYTDFSQAVMVATVFEEAGPGNMFDRTRFVDGLRYGPLFVPPGPTGGGPVPTPFRHDGTTFTDVSFVKGSLRGDFRMATFGGTIRFTDVLMSAVNFCGASMPVLTQVLYPTLKSDGGTEWASNPAGKVTTPGGAPWYGWPTDSGGGGGPPPNRWEDPPLSAAQCGDY